MFQGMDYVYAGYKERSFSKAAEKLFISQPSLSANVKREEKIIGYPIFDRSTKPIGLTEPGKRYIEMIQQIKTMQAEFTEYINDLDNLRAGNLILGGSSLYSSLIYPSLSNRFTQKFPLIQINLKEANCIQLEKMLLYGEIDFLLDNCELDRSTFLCKVFRREYLILAVPKALSVNNTLEKYQISEESICNQSFLNDDVPTVDLTSFQSVPFIMLNEENGTRIHAMELCHQNHFKPDILFELDQQMTAYTITCSGLGASFVSDTLITDMPTEANVVYYKLEPREGGRNLYFYWKKSRYFSKVMETFLRLTE